MSSNKRYYAVAIIGVFMIAGLISFNRWLINQMDQIQDVTMKKARAPSVIPTEDTRRYGKPMIDPLNDPLAPVIKISSETKKKRTASVSENKKIYEMPQSSSPILAQ
jgi:hypothetical protein